MNSWDETQIVQLYGVSLQHNNRQQYFELICYPLKWLRKHTKYETMLEIVNSIKTMHRTCAPNMHLGYFNAEF